MDYHCRLRFAFMQLWDIPERQFYNTVTLYNARAFSGVLLYRKLLFIFAFVPVASLS